MPCLKCGIDKLSNEFPPAALSEDCDHPTIICLRCTISHVKNTSSCPYPGCSQKVDVDSENVHWFEAILDLMTFMILHLLDSSATVNITVLNGESMQIVYNPAMTINEVKRQIQIKLSHDINKQKLLYKDKELQIYKPGGEYARLSDYQVKPNSTIYLVIILYSIPDTLNDVVFDLFWGYPVSGVDYLDASCLLLNRNSFVSVVDWSQRHGLQGSVHHSGDVMNDAARIGHHTINVKLKSIPADITHMFFTLSAWNSPNIARYPNPSLKFYEAANPNKNLCKTTFNHARNSQAVVMCSVSRNQRGCWEIYESGQLSAGNANKYNPLKKTIQSLISQGY
ncbi:LOW QUALITY PROTEIN: hypothetical protein KUTeg_003602 [Tegillarca granosa]|uniref:Ubiquitin-like domain-containing protein n=1 Tax=Tegillarca granosa TaxID=220873 RepID=A0ABQ9FP79_TEGGR|nr:LOW QUALITY PROTEIN: hypothetical protein KUTeg_003602 [Tegillarca granosa]